VLTTKLKKGKVV